MRGSGRRNGGFTLIEVLVAVAVLAIALAAVIGATVHMADNAAYLNNKTLATLVAHNRLARYQLSPQWPALGTDSGNVTLGNHDWEWKAKVSKTQDPSLRRVDVRVMLSSGNQPLASLSGFFAPPNPH